MCGRRSLGCSVTGSRGQPSRGSWLGARGCAGWRVDRGLGDRGSRRSHSVGGTSGWAARPLLGGAIDVSGATRGGPTMTGRHGAGQRGSRSVLLLTRLRLRDQRRTGLSRPGLSWASVSRPSWSTAGQLTAGLLTAGMSRAVRLRPGPRRRGSRDQGQSTVVVIGVIGAAVAVLLGAVDLTRAVNAAHVARSAADLAALAAAQAAVRGNSAAAACADAGHYARANHAALQTCSLASDGSATVTVTVTTPGPIPRTARSIARAGPG